MQNIDRLCLVILQSQTNPIAYMVADFNTSISDRIRSVSYSNIGIKAAVSEKICQRVSLGSNSSSSHISSGNYLLICLESSDGAC
jgi:hypothetical protein